LDKSIISILLFFSKIMSLKKLVISIIILLCIFSKNSAFSYDLSMWEYLNIDYEIEAMDLSFAYIKDVRYKNRKMNIKLKLFNRKLKILNKHIKDLMIVYYKDWKISYYQFKWMITNYKDFIFYLSKHFEYLKIKETTPNLWEINYSIHKNYRNIRESYTKVVDILKYE